MERRHELSQQLVVLQCPSSLSSLRNPTLAARGDVMKQETFNVLFLCTGNSARSIMAEAFLNFVGRPKFKAFSAASHPVGKVNPLALALLEKNRFPTQGLRSKDWSEFSWPGRAVPSFCVYRVRSGGSRTLPGLARTTDDRALGHSGSGC